MGNLMQRIERLELRLISQSDGNCLACSLARLAGPIECDGTACSLKLADLLATGEACATR